MVAQTLVETASHTLCADLQTRLIGYASRLEEFRTLTEVLDDLMPPRQVACRSPFWGRCGSR